MKRRDWPGLPAYIFLLCWMLSALKHQSPSSSVLRVGLALLAPQACRQPIVGTCDHVSQYLINSPLCMCVCVYIYIYSISSVPQVKPDECTTFSLFKIFPENIEMGTKLFYFI